MNFRMVIFVLPALLVTSILFLLMTSILHQSQNPENRNRNRSIISANFLMPDRKIESILKIEKPVKPEVIRPPKLPQPTINSVSSELSTLKVKFEIPVINPNINISLTMPEAPSDSDYVPLLKVAPLYPPRAAKRNLEGYVVVEYSISVTGQVLGVKIIESEPPDVFDKSAIEAARKFKYKPRKENGETISVKGVKNKFTFRLEK